MPVSAYRCDDAEFVARLGAGRAAGAFGKDDDLAAATKLDARALRHVGQRLRRAVPRSTGIMPAFQAYQPKNGIHMQFAFQDEGGVGEQPEQRESLP